MESRRWKGWNILIKVEHLSKKFGNNEVLKDINLHCEKGKIYGIIGYNGSGKTVLFKCICGFLKSDKGKILIAEKVLGKDIDMITNAGVIIENPGFIERISGYKNLEFLFTIRNKKEKEYIQEVMRKVGLDPFVKKSVKKYSLGMKQRLAIAQAVMENPDILILDEPMNGLDKNGIKEMRELFLALRAEGKTILLASHNKEDIEILCDEVYEIENATLQKVK